MDGPIGRSDDGTMPGPRRDHYLLDKQPPADGQWELGAIAREELAMARVRPLNTYPNEFWNIVQGAGAEGKEFTIRCENITKALGMQGKFYAFRQAMHREMQGLSGQDREKMEQKYVWALQTICWVDKGTAAGGQTVVRFCNKDKHPDAVLLRSAIVTVNPLPIPESVETTFEKALRLQREQDEKDAKANGGKYG